MLSRLSCDHRSGARTLVGGVKLAALGEQLRVVEALLVETVQVGVLAIDDVANLVKGVGAAVIVARVLRASAS